MSNTRTIRFMERNPFIVNTTSGRILSLNVDPPTPVKEPEPMPGTTPNEPHKDPEPSPTKKPQEPPSPPDTPEKREPQRAPVPGTPQITPHERPNRPGETPGPARQHPADPDPSTPVGGQPGGHLIR